MMEYVIGVLMFVGVVGCVVGVIFYNKKKKNKSEDNIYPMW